MHRNGNGKSASTLEHEAEQTRAQLSATLDELRHSMSPGQIVDQFFDYAKDSGGADFFRNLGQQMKANPLPVTLIGAGIAWLMMSGTRSHSRPVTARGSQFSGSDFAESGHSSPGMGQRLKGVAQ
ncbi:MAG TPA: DUF3618 domain-containing protein, partial [Woeseiaceae bacterium]|nr:DUF3618 domain-containing protein [Woeseiaceae bacterium]